MELKGKRVLITGGSRGIGKATAALLHERGAIVGITGRNRERLMQTARQFGLIPIQADVGNPDDVKRTFDEFLSEAGGIDVLINNAGLARGHDLVFDLKWEDFEYVYRVNVFGPAMMAKYAAEIFRKQQSGTIVNVGSTAALRGYPRGSVYASSKFALRGLTECWRAELRQYNIRVMLVNPSLVITGFGRGDQPEPPEQPDKLRPVDIARAIANALEMDDRAFIPEFSIWATNPKD